MLLAILLWHFDIVKTDSLIDMEVWFCDIVKLKNSLIRKCGFVGSFQCSLASLIDLMYFWFSILNF